MTQRFAHRLSCSVRLIIREASCSVRALIMVALVTVASLSHLGLARGQLTTDADTLRVLQFLDGDQEEPLVMIEGGHQAGTLEGEIFYTVRSSNPRQTATVPNWIETSRLKVVEVRNTFTIAKVTGDTTSLSRALFPQFPGVMTGDLVVRQKVKLQKRQTLLPATTLTYQNLFQDPGAAPRSFELHTEGSSYLSSQAAVFGEAKLSLLIVEGHTDSAGNSADNQIESYQRALTVRQFLIDDLGFDEQRVVAIGYGEAELTDPSMAPDATTANRRIVLKAVPLPSS